MQCRASATCRPGAVWRSSKSTQSSSKTYRASVLACVHAPPQLTAQNSGAMNTLGAFIVLFAMLLLCTATLRMVQRTPHA